MKIPTGYHIEPIEEYIPNKAIRIGNHIVFKIGINPVFDKYIESGVIDIKRALINYLNGNEENISSSAYEDIDYDGHLSDYYEEDRIPTTTRDGLIKVDFHIRIGMGTIIIDGANISGEI